jgi:hypothetical protein
MSRDKGSGVLDLVEVTPSSQRVVGRLPAGSDVVAAGMMGRFFD